MTSSKSIRYVPPAMSIVAASLLAGACALGGANIAAPRLYDFGIAAASQVEVPRVAIGSVRAAPTVSGTEIRYRLASDPYQARAYSESRWLAAPSELLANRLAAALGEPKNPNDGSLVGPPRPASFRLSVELAVFEQIFDTPNQARAVLRLVAEVQDSRTRRTVGRRVLDSERATPTADAAGAVASLVELTDEAVRELLRWLALELEAYVPPAPAESGKPWRSRQS
ncbi:MAG TPA: ABC-type transport auxiliary lipoprotein family protein [Thermoanaerobaculia bacterium]|nr:ABC-type transport auxiliary lipoprotein family protein [Thermoanaerobaculia bacterium]